MHNVGDLDAFAVALAAIPETEQAAVVAHVQALVVMTVSASRESKSRVNGNWVCKTNGRDRLAAWRISAPRDHGEILLRGTRHMTTYHEAFDHGPARWYGYQGDPGQNKRALEGRPAH